MESPFTKIYNIVTITGWLLFKRFMAFSVIELLKKINFLNFQALLQYHEYFTVNVMTISSYLDIHIW